MKSDNIFTFIPNLIGYLRLVLYSLSFTAHVVGHWLWCVVLYGIALVLDDLDGRAANYFNQTTQFGAALDMVSDRAATAGLCMILAQVYPGYLLIFIWLVALDIGSHYYLLKSTYLQKNKTHKNTSSWSKNWLLNHYYSSKAFMMTLIAGAELFYLLLYLKYNLITTDTINYYFPYVLQTLVWVTFSVFLVKQIINVIQLKESALLIASHDSKQRQSLYDDLSIEKAANFLCNEEQTEA